MRKSTLRWLVGGSAGAAAAYAAAYGLTHAEEVVAKVFARPENGRMKPAASQEPSRSENQVKVTELVP